MYTIPLFSSTIQEEVRARISIKDPFHAKLIQVENENLLKGFYTYFFKPVSDLTKGFEHWWTLMAAVISSKPHETCLKDVSIDSQGSEPPTSSLKTIVKPTSMVSLPATEVPIKDQSKGKALMDSNDNPNAPYSVPKLMGDSIITP